MYKNDPAVDNTTVRPLYAFEMWRKDYSKGDVL